MSTEQGSGPAKDEGKVQKKKRVPKKKKSFARLLGLGKEKEYIINDLLINGEKPALVARIIQQDWKQYRDVSEESLRRQLTRYRDEKLAPSAAPILAPTPKEKKVVVTRCHERMDVLKEMVNLACIQENRIERMIQWEEIQWEEQKKTPFPFLANDMRDYRETLKTIFKMQIDTGVIEHHGTRAINQNNLQINNTYTPPGSVPQQVFNDLIDDTLKLIASHSSDINVTDADVVEEKHGDE